MSEGRTLDAEVVHARLAGAYAKHRSPAADSVHGGDRGGDDQGAALFGLVIQDITRQLEVFCAISDMPT